MMKATVFKPEPALQTKTTDTLVIGACMYQRTPSPALRRGRPRLDWEAIGGSDG